MYNINKPRDDWENLYLLRYYGQQGHPYLTTWIDGDLPLPKVWVIVLSNMIDVPLWNSPVKNGIKYVEIDSSNSFNDLLRLANELDGHLAFGWKVLVPDRLISYVLDN